MQRKLIRWWRMKCGEFGVPECLLFSIPNGGGGGEKRGHWLKLEGCRKGACDLVLAVARMAGSHAFFDEGHHALFLELKTETGRISAEQLQFHEALRAAGYKVEVVRSFDQGVETITNYLK